jgi:adhesin transport system membrane fusion protein
MLIFLIIAYLWAKEAKLDEVTRAEGKVIPSNQVQIVQNLEGGIIAEILAQEGQIVDKNQVLLRIDDTRFASSFRESNTNIMSLQAKVMRLQAEVNGKKLKVTSKLKKYPKLVASEKLLYKSRQQKLISNINILKEQQKQQKHEIRKLQAKQKKIKHGYQLANKELKITEPLVKQGVMSEIDLLRLKREVNNLNGERETIRLSIPKIRSTIKEIQRKIDELRINFRTKALTKLNDYKVQLASFTESNTALKDKVTRTTVRSPVKGTIKRIKINTIGGIVQPGMDLVEIIPLEDNLLIEAKVRPADIAFLYSEQVATVKFTAYDFSIFGGLSGKLKHISADTITDKHDKEFYLIKILTDKNYLGSKKKSLPIIAGMTVTVDILTGHKTILDYLLKPLNKAKENALRER